MTRYLNMRGPSGLETVDEFTAGQDAPREYRNFLRYVRRMSLEYNLAGMDVYISRRPCRGWTTCN